MHDSDQKYGYDILPTSEPRDAGCLLSVFNFFVTKCRKRVVHSSVEVFADFCDKLQQRGNFWRGAP